MRLLLDSGLSPASLDDRGSSLSGSCISQMPRDYNFYLRDRRGRDIDSSDSRGRMKMVHMLVRRGARWEPADGYPVNSARWSLLKMKSDYVMEFVWIMSEYRACSRDTIESLTPAIRELISGHKKRYAELLELLEGFADTRHLASTADVQL